MHIREEHISCDLYFLGAKPSSSITTCKYSALLPPFPMNFTFITRYRRGQILEFLRSFRYFSYFGHRSLPMSFGAATFTVVLHCLRARASAISVIHQTKLAPRRSLVMFLWLSVRLCLPFLQPCGLNNPRRLMMVSFSTVMVSCLGIGCSGKSTFGWLRWPHQALITATFNLFSNPSVFVMCPWFHPSRSP